MRAAASPLLQPMVTPRALTVNVANVKDCEGGMLGIESEKNVVCPLKHEIDLETRTLFKMTFNLPYLIIKHKNTILPTRYM